MKNMRFIKPLIWTIIITTIAYAIVVTVSSVLLYQRVCAPEVRHESLLYTSDDTLGFKPIPNSSGELILCAGDTVPIRFDDYGFRMPNAGTSSPFTPDSVDVLYLGCSFTFGYGCRA